jgi:hypothetical protein
VKLLIVLLLLTILYYNFNTLSYWRSVSVCGLGNFLRKLFPDGMSLRNADIEKLVRIWSALNGKGNTPLATFSDFLEFEL